MICNWLIPHVSPVPKVCYSYVDTLCFVISWLMLFKKYTSSRIIWPTICFETSIPQRAFAHILKHPMCLVKEFDNVKVHISIFKCLWWNFLHGLPFYIANCLQYYQKGAKNHKNSYVRLQQLCNIAMLFCNSQHYLYKKKFHF